MKFIGPQARKVLVYVVERFAYGKMKETGQGKGISGKAIEEK